MSDEFFALIPETAKPNFTNLFQELSRRLPLALVSASGEMLRLRWSDLSVRSDWPEDIRISCCENGLLTSIDMGTAKQRRTLLISLEYELTKELAIPVKFEEL